MARAAAITTGALAAYAAFVFWRLRALRRAAQEGRRLGPAWLGLWAAWIMQKMAEMNGVKVASESGEGLLCDHPGQIMYCWHPHGFVSFVPSFLMGEKAIRGQPHGTEWFGTCIELLFRIPILGEVFQVTNARPVDKHTLESILSHGKGLAIQPGGVKEQAATRHDQEQAFFGSKLGFIRLAIKHGTPLMPLYLFGENQLYKRVDGMEWLTRLIKRATGMTLPIMTAKAGLPVALLLPRATDIHVRWGRLVEVGPPDPNPSDERVQEVFARYLEELQRLFDAHAMHCLPQEVAAKGLKLVLPEKPVSPASRL
eukprot:gb/GFBE01077576.1/.p1 GENE.gb/GFBE01077576.1/~~gb/GFBE01077576.1/.p1  ORF type:complete len:312 (+),score=41.56 gb/GFBE01077576.1/:1-936(+)